MQHKVVVCAALACAVALAVPAHAAAPPWSGLPRAATFVPGESLAGVRVGMTKAEVLRAWGRRHGVCQECGPTVWYFNYRPFEPQGAGIVFRDGRVFHAFTIWRPRGWRTPAGLKLGAPATAVRSLFRGAFETQCDRYSAFARTEGETRSAVYVFRGKVWGFGLMAADTGPCI